MVPQSSVSVTVKARADGRGYYANVKAPTGQARQLSWPTEADGQRWVAIYVRDGWDAAMADYKRLKAVRGDRSLATADRAQGRTVMDAARAYIDDVPGESSRRSYRGRLPVLDRFPDLARCRVDRVTVEDVTLFAKWLGTQHDAPSVRYNAWALLNMTLNREVREGFILGNPVQAMAKRDRPHAPKSAESRQVVTLVDDDEVEAILGVITDAAPALLFRTLYASAARLSEGLALAPRHVKLEGDVARIIVERTWSHDESGGGWHLALTTKGKTARDVYVPRALGERLLALGVDEHGCLAFGKHSALEMRWNHARNKAAALGLAPEGVRIHDLRHSRITNLLEAGAPVVAVSRMAGHASVQFTLDRYGHVRDDAARALGLL